MKRFCFCVCLFAFSQSLCSVVVQKIVVKGAVRIDRSFVLSHIPFKKGQDVSDDDLQKMLRDLFATGMFADVKGSIAGNTLYLNVTENDVLNQVVCEGNKKIDSEDILKELDIKPRQVYTPYRVQKAAQRIKELYRLRGNVGAVVTPKIIRRSQGRVDLIFEIQDGRPQKIKSILFQGNKKISDDDLRSAILTRETRWWRFFSSVDTYEPDRLIYDRELLFRHYRNEGYADVSVTSVLTELSPSQQDFYITFHIQEGDVYNFGKVDVISKAPYIKASPLEAIAKKQSWKKFNQSQIEAVTQELNRVLSEDGKFCAVDADIRQNKSARTIDVTFVIVPRKPLYAANVLVRGNIATNDSVIRREAVVAPGDPLTPFRVDQTRQRISNLDFFKKVDISVEDVPNAEDQKDVVIDVEDKSTGELMFSGGYSTSDGPLLEVKASERNFQGRGQEVEARATLAKRSKSVVLGFTEPYFLNRRVQAGVDGFFQHLQQDTLGTFEGGYVRSSYGASTRLGYYLGSSLLERFRYTASKERFKDNKARSVFYSEMGNDFKSLVGHDLIYDKRDSVINPTRGGYGVWSLNFAGVGGNVRYLQNDFTVGYYWAFDDDRDLVLRLRGRYGVLTACGKPLRVTDHFFMGGESVRGFEDVGIGPRDRATGDALGGRQSIFVNFELSHPLGKKSYGLMGFLFNDWGSLWSSGLVDGPHGDLVDADQFAVRASVGFGVRFQSPFGLLGFSVGFPLKKIDKVDKTHIFRINIGTEF